jgi:hypothetical protein
MAVPHSLEISQTSTPSGLFFLLYQCFNLTLGTFQTPLSLIPTSPHTYFLMLTLETTVGTTGPWHRVSYRMTLTGDQVFEIAIRQLSLDEIGSFLLFLESPGQVRFLHLTRNDTLLSAGAAEGMRLSILAPADQPHWLITPASVALSMKRASS